jgi:hypothetical protein
MEYRQINPHAGGQFRAVIWEESIPVIMHGYRCPLYYNLASSSERKTLIKGV